ncbi:hypothetical protein Pd630_LPD15013 (plasmid) [Rhodococcus opacus PD630]|nr:hypothetical protein Pd630_LPD15013 [Rhodococcus opacus PD630]
MRIAGHDSDVIPGARAESVGEGLPVPIAIMKVGPSWRQRPRHDTADGRSGIEGVTFTLQE